MKDFDTFSFSGKAPKAQKSSTPKSKPLNSSRSPQKIPNWRQMTYRFERNLQRRPPSQQQRATTYQNYFINEKINKIDEQLTENIKRRIELEKKLYQERLIAKQKQNQKFYVDNFCKTQGQVQKIYVNMEKKSNDVDNMLKRESQLNYQSSYLENVQKSTQKNTKYLIKRSPQQTKKMIVPDQLVIQKLLKQATFPQVPSTNLALLEKQCEPLLITSQHSDLFYIMMVISFHQQKHHNVRKYFREIQMYKVFENKAYWVACQNQFQLENYELCLKLCEICMKAIEDRWMHRFLFLQAKCYQKLGNFVKSIVCYNQLIKIKPKVAELFLERAIIYDKIGYPVEAKQDYIEFSVLQPKARELLKQKILVQKNQIKRKQLIKALAKIT